MYKIYKIHDNFSEDSRSPLGEEILAYTTDWEVAKEIADGRGNYSGDAQVTECGYVVTSVADYEYMLNREPIERALAKLTPEEKRLLKIQNF